ncbi:hypothetical protein QBC45DRAFT_475319 [Copromyces sp. CBS 386.78]|nr:hypothetical protein QBC45DRAFT_475319 [Copromyces sp. CBS 386.78]
MHLSTLIVTSLTAAGSASAFHWGTSAPPAGFGAAAAATDAVAPAPAGFSGPPSGGPPAPPAPGTPAGGARRPAQAAAVDAAEEDGVVAVTDVADEGDDADAVATTAEDESDCEEEEGSDDEGDDSDAVVASSTIIDCPIPTNFIWNGAPVVVTASTVLTLPCTTDAAGASAAPFHPPPARPPHGPHGPWSAWAAPAFGSAAPATNSFSTVPCDSFVTQTAVATATATEVVIPVTHAEPTWTKAPAQPSVVTAGAARGYPATAIVLAVVAAFLGFN